MADYLPRLPVQLWLQLKPFVDGSVVDAVALTPYRDVELYAAVTPLAAWMVTQAGLPLDREVAFDPHTIDRFCMEGLVRYTKAGRGTMRSRLRRVSEVLLPGLAEPPRERAFGPSVPNAPYSEAQQIMLSAWARSLPSARSTQAQRLLSLGLGAGLIGSEIGRAHIGDIKLAASGVTVAVRGPRARTVPVLDEWSAALILAQKSESPDTWLFREGRDALNHNLVTDFVTRHPAQVPLQARKMRATWLVYHLNSGAPLIALLKAAGLENAEGLDRLLQFVDPDAATNHPLSF
ncbi:hypothetical protein ASC66_04460 [Leifsonia sp. Root4]|uniref:hypothetical protein n=1 Tax=Leifsonia sp. Root4 TaxID=1736525 RepID=UPI0006FFBA14|nr:hypothetical protein [Leifsonia sp. Root4]KQW08190.1 hypothetical protein ASC66_04460 [Leifsonia sp. Root4]